MEHRKTGRLLLPPLYYPLDSAHHAPGTGRGLQTIDLCRENVDYEVPAAAPHGGGRLSRAAPGTERLFPASILFFTRLFASSLASERGLHTLFFAGLQVKGVALDLLDNIFLLHLAFEAAQSVF